MTTTSTEIATTTGAIATQPTTELTIRSDQSEFTPIQRAALAQIGVEEASDDDVKVFFHQCRTTGLDPFRKQIYMIGRRTKTKQWNPDTRQQEEKWVMKQTIQIGIDGYRLGGRRIANALGIKIEKDGPYWHDGNGWVDVWLNPNQPPAAAKYTITRDGETNTVIANYAEYVQTYSTQSGPKPNAMWAKMPANQLAKCAEAAAWRQAFPDTFSGVVFEDAANHSVIDGAVVDEAPKKTKEGGRGVAALAAQIGVQSAPDAVEAEVVQEQQEASADTAKRPNPQQNKRLSALFERCGLTKDDKPGRRIVFASFFPDRELGAAPSADETDHVIAQLETLADSGEDDSVLVAYAEDVITQHSQAQQTS